MSDLIRQAVDRLKAGELVGMPTETVYGLAADATNPEAVRKIFAAKQRPADHPLIVHLHNPCLNTMDLKAREEAWSNVLAEWSRDVSPEALILATKFWPGPLTMILPKAKGVLNEVTGGQDTVGLRCPDQAIALELLKAFGTGLAAPSANRFGRISPTTAAHVQDEFKDLDLLVLDGGPCRVGIESTIVDLTRLSSHGPVILRPGIISQHEIEQALQIKGQTLLAGGPRVSGSLSAHYAPRTRMLFVNNLDSLAINKNSNVAWVHFPDPTIPNSLSNSNVTEVEIASDMSTVARQLYALLRNLDTQNFDLICFDELPEDPSWDAVRDRLTRAVTGSGINS
jgi:L-threonylcarbamoyladenylate synthase